MSVVPRTTAVSIYPILLTPKYKFEFFLVGAKICVVSSYIGIEFAFIYLAYESITGVRVQVSIFHKLYYEFIFDFIPHFILPRFFRAILYITLF
jgi:hypothetical protein